MRVRRLRSKFRWMYARCLRNTIAMSRANWRTCWGCPHGSGSALETIFDEAADFLGDLQRAQQRNIRCGRINPDYFQILDLVFGFGGGFLFGGSLLGGVAGVVGGDQQHGAG